MKLVLKFQRHQIVAPGELLGIGKYYAGEGTFKEGDKIYSSILGLAEQRGKTIYVVPLQGTYFPKVGDIVIAKILNASPAGYRADINSLYSAAIFPDQAERNNRRIRDRNIVYDVGDIIIAKIISFDRTHDPFLSTVGEGLGKLKGGRIIKIHPTRVPRLIGKKGSMIKMIKEETNARIKIGQNGLIWISVDDDRMEDIIIKVVRK
ncbi:MAG: exosome complex RNA-binding protein Rrp4, partial [Candidatus Odinarchaeia archaeon]